MEVAEAANESLLKYYVREFSAVPTGGGVAGRGFFIDENSAKAILNKYNYEWGKQ